MIYIAPFILLPLLAIWVYAERHLGFAARLSIGLALVVLCSAATHSFVLPGDHVMMEGFTFLARKPRRGDIVDFKTDGIAPLPAATIYVKPVAGEPGDRLRISEGKLYINDSC